MANTRFIAVVAVTVLLATIGPVLASAIDGIETPLSPTRANPDSGRAIVSNRQIGLCVLCHAGPFADPRFQGSIGPDLTGVGSRLSEGQIRLRVADARRLNPDSVMPSYFNTENRHRVALAFEGRPILTAAQIEDVVAYLATLRDAK